MSAARSGAGYVIAPHGQVYLWVPARNPWGFALVDEVMSYLGGRGIEEGWVRVDDDDPRIQPRDRARLGWILQQFRSGNEPGTGPSMPRSFV